MVNEKKDQQKTTTEAEKKPENQEKSTDPKDLKDKKNAKPVEEDLVSSRVKVIFNQSKCFTRARKINN
jgi:hypothetical protein